METTIDKTIDIYNLFNKAFDDIPWIDMEFYFLARTSSSKNQEYDLMRSSFQEWYKVITWVDISWENDMTKIKELYKDKENKYDSVMKDKLENMDNFVQEMVWKWTKLQAMTSFLMLSIIRDTAKEIVVWDKDEKLSIDVFKEQIAKATISIKKFIDSKE